MPSVSCYEKFYETHGLKRLKIIIYMQRMKTFAASVVLFINLNLVKSEYHNYCTFCFYFAYN